ncbi:related to SER3 - 3-phosphoglycerate dehydrogenase [Cephalotrichum gorgonifer]|uniref:Related to SER3 - 3-phosphoglycerate dehydrogenase n=1 Tax=Cephalotrichum gorgonifer TaxID=2041049 RepID=A0AAE8MT38_9PEZI|nr:related to SER3 - 3-phosphoglycerate dehydrogenase [Cephalotrichum gorgonifer]
MTTDLVSNGSAATSPTDKPTVYILHEFHPDVMAFCRQVFNAITPDHPENSNWRQNARYLLMRSSYITAEDINAAPNLLAIAKQGVGIDRIDAEACKVRGIQILNTPGVNAQPVAELVLMLTLAVARRAGSTLIKQSSGNLVSKEECFGLTLQGKTIGIIGMGNIGKAVARIFHGGFGARIIAYNHSAPDSEWSGIPHTRVEHLEDIWSEADVMSIHVPLTPKTRGLISYPQLQSMKKTAILINTARGGIINEKDLERALSEGLIWGAGLDCHEEEPPSKERYGALWDLGVVSMPHIGATTDEIQRLAGMTAAKRLLEFTQRTGTI